MIAAGCLHPRVRHQNPHGAEKGAQRDHAGREEVHSRSDFVPAKEQQGEKSRLEEEGVVSAALAVTLIQVFYWLNQRCFAKLRVGQNPLLGHLILFLSRLNFIYASSLFSAVCLVRFKGRCALYRCEELTED
jgi:hypothetical protein